jgi:predicted nuclease of predicted toxin-antitoxin system
VKFLVDNQPPLQLAHHLAKRDHESMHVSEVGLDGTDDQVVWSWANQRGFVVVSKDEDFFFLAHRPADTGRLVWVRLGNCRKAPLLAAIDSTLEAILAAFDGGQRIVELA